ncbi:MAG: hypothetical protein EOO47_00810 [Flavobacterium sp.]|nr:MAG: hypothetical protein EOO47_00810 [Flavobacterium sp.]
MRWQKRCFVFLLTVATIILIAFNAKAQQIEVVNKMPLGVAKSEAVLLLLNNPFTLKSPVVDKLIEEELDYARNTVIARTKLYLAGTNYYLNIGAPLRAKLFLQQAESLSVKINVLSRTEFTIEIAELNVKLQNPEIAKKYLSTLAAKSRGQSSLYLSINNLLQQADVYALLSDNENKDRLLAMADDLAEDLGVKVSEDETSNILCLLIINSIKLGRNANLDHYYQQLLIKEKNNNEPAYLQAVAMYQDYKKQYVRAEQSYKKLTHGYLNGDRSQYGFEALVRLANLFSKQLNVDSAQRYFAYAKRDLNPAFSNQPLGILYSQLYSEHLLRFNQNKQLITSVSNTLKLRDSNYKAELEATLKEANYKYSIITNSQKIKLLTQQKELADLSAFKMKQRNWLIILSLFLLALGAFTLSYVYYQKRKKGLLQFEAEKERTEHEHYLEMNKMLATSQEEERTRIAEKLHDEIGSMLALVRFNLSILHQDETTILPSKQLSTANKVLGDVADTVRQMSHELMPVALNKLGLKKAIEQLIWDINTAGKVNVESVIMGIEQGEATFAYDFQVNIYRIVQELFQNILKHAKATHVLFQLLVRSDGLNVIIEDDGVGIAANGNYGGKGMKLINARLNNYKGKMTIDAQNRLGALIIIDIPLEYIKTA